MLRKLLFLFFAIIGYGSLFAQDTASISAPPPSDTSHLRISLLTCGPGHNEIWEVFGHTAIRVIDSAQHLDLVYGYGTFEFGEGFELKFMRGKLLYYISVAEFEGFMPEYVIAKRSVEEQELSLEGPQKQAMYEFLNWNARPENMYYKYDFFFDNCATRLRDVFPKSFGNRFTFGRAIPEDSKLTFRDIMNQYFYRDHWTRLGCNLLLGSRIDKIMSNTDIMFLPDYLRDGVAGAKIEGKNIATPPQLLLAGGPALPTGINQPFIVTCIVALLTILGLSIHNLRLLGKIMSGLLLIVTGILGVIILIMWFATDHQGCSDNFNLLWCLPTNLIIVFTKARGKAKYAIIAIMFLFIFLILHIIKVQGLALLELAPLFLALLFAYGMIYRSNKTPKQSNA
ncbi:MAG: rane protein [Flavipsychrobacter sp.]|jgi:hypothetical protein|nr:rane protein [Flavipsychrobacter sp.]